MLTPPTVWCALVPSRSQPDGFKLNYDPIRPEATCFKADPKFDYSGGLRFKADPKFDYSGGLRYGGGRGGKGGGKGGGFGKGGGKGDGKWFWDVPTKSWVVRGREADIIERMEQARARVAKDESAPEPEVEQATGTGNPAASSSSAS